VQQQQEEAFPQLGEGTAQLVEARRAQEAEHGGGAEGDVSWCELRRCGRQHHLEVSGGVTRSQLIARLLEHMRTQAPLSWPINDQSQLQICL